MSASLVAWAVGLAGVLLAAFVKGTIGFGFPAVATPLVALATDVRTAVVVLLLPNMVMDLVQVFRRPGLGAALRRHALLIAAGVVGTVAGTQFLVLVSGTALLVLLGTVILLFVAFSVARPAWRLPAHLETPAAPLVGLAAGVIGGVTNVFSLPMAPYLYALGLPKVEFVRAMSMAFLVFKATQFLAVWQVGLMRRPLLLLSLGATVATFGAFRLGLMAQDRIPAETFNRAVLAFLSLVSISMLVRAVAQ
jgi:uncharacterized membrane protein YfcA